MKKVYLIFTKIALRFHNFFYELASKMAVKTDGGLHPKHRLMDYHRFFVDNINHGDTILDIGCGNGALTFDIAKKAAEVVGIDLNKKSIKLAEERFSAPNIKYIVGNALKDLPDKKFNVITLSNVLEHIQNRIEFLSKIKNLSPKILIRVPMINRDWITLYKKELGLSYMLDKAHFIEYTLESFQEELNMADLKIKKYSVQFGEIWTIIS